jgi:pyridoxamine 5'-phosphate oxidase family protein
MSTFTEKEIEYLRGQPLGRLATVGRDGSPHVVPVGFRLGLEDETIEVGGHALKGSKKWRDLEANPRVAFVIDDLERVDPWTPRGLEVRGRAEFARGGRRALRRRGARHGYGSCRGGSSATPPRPASVSELDVAAIFAGNRGRIVATGVVTAPTPPTRIGSTKRYSPPAALMHSTSAHDLMQR